MLNLSINVNLVILFASSYSSLTNILEDYSRSIVKNKIFKDLIYYSHSFLLSLHLSRRLLFMLNLILRGFNISIRVLCMSFFHLDLKSSGCIRRAPENSATAVKRYFLLFQIGREDRNREDLYRRSSV